MTEGDQIKYKYRGMVIPEKVIPEIESGNYEFVHKQKLGYYFSYETDVFQFHVVDRFASFPLFYCIKGGKPYVSENVEDLITILDKIEFDPVGFYTTGGLFKGERTELTPFVGIKRIMPGHYMEYKNGHINIIQYWSFLDLKDKPFTGTIDEAAEKLGFLINKAVKRCYDFDKNCAIHLSGGIDSGVIASLYASLTGDEVQAYLFKQNDDPMIEGTESGFVKRYMDQHSNIKLESFDFQMQYSDSKFSIGNWHTIQSNSHDELLILHAAKNGHKFILTGLGGDELVSYRLSSHIVKQLVGNDQQAIELLKYRNRLSLRAKNIIKLIIDQKENPLHALKLYSSNKFLSERHIWYTKDFCKKNKHLMAKPPMSPEFYPASLEYRLDVLSRSWFTIRSDIWNYQGAEYGVDFIHPFLDADLVSFAACIPAKMYLKIGKRELFKKAVEKYIPSHLLTDVKRTLYKREIINSDLLEKQYMILLGNICQLEDSIVMNIFDFRPIRRQIKISLKKLYLAKKYKKYEQLYLLESRLNIYKMLFSNIYYLKNFN